MNVIVVGCGRVGSQLAELLSVEGHNVTVIDSDAEAFRRLGSAFNGVTVRGVGFDEKVLEEAGIEEADVLCAVTDLDNTNMMTAEVARKVFDVPHVVARLYNPQRERTYQQLDLDYVCGTTLVAEKLLDKIQSGHGHHISQLLDVEVLEFKVGPQGIGRRVKDVESDHEVRMIAVARGVESFIPDSDTVLEEGDVVMAAIREQSYDKLKRYMEK